MTTRNITVIRIATKSILTIAEMECQGLVKQSIAVLCGMILRNLPKEEENKHEGDTQLHLAH